MGVPKFYRWISERYPCLSEVVREYQIPEFDNLYLDMNGIIHNCSHPNDEDVHFRISEEKIFQDIFRYIEFLFRMIKPRKVFFMAIDGVAPRAKMNQQRGRRFRSAKEAETRENEAKQRGETLPDEKRFDSNCITPGTEFMDRLHQHLKYFVSNKITSDDLWRDVKVILSGHETPGEGEHKVMDFIRFEKSQPNYDPNTRHCLYGLDADLIMLGMCSHEPHFSLLREEVKYIRSKSEKNKRDSNPEAITFHLFHLSLFREYIEHEFEELKTTLGFAFDLENIIDDWVLMGFLVGNDFIPHIPHFHINKSSLLKLYSVYKKVLPTLDGYLNENGSLNLRRFQKYLDALKQLDIDNFNEFNADFKHFESRTGRKLFNRETDDSSDLLDGPQNCAVIPNASDLMAARKSAKKLINISNSDDNESYNSDDVYDSESSDKSLLEDEFTAHKRDYYINKLKYETMDESVLREQSHEYIRALQWNLHYYYNGCMSWGWYYPHHYAPFISDVNGFDDIDLNFDFGDPFKPFEQLLAVLPSASRDLLPKAYEPLVTNPDSPLIDYYPEDFETDMNEKQQAWEAVVLIPFIQENRLLSAVEDLKRNLSADEKRRNRHGPHLVFTYSDVPLESIPSPNAAVFPELPNRAKCEKLEMNAFRIPIERITKGLCDGVELDVYFPGFPTLQHIPHDIVIRKERVRVFESASMNENMMLILKNEETVDVNYAVEHYLNKTIFVNWPHLLEAQVFQVSNGECKYTMKRNSIVCEEMEEKEFSETDIFVNAKVRRYKERWGVVVGQTQVVLHVYPMTGRKYAHGSKGRVTLEKIWSSVPMVCPFQTVVKDLNIYDKQIQQFQTIDEMYPIGAKCFVVDNPYYGSEAKVIECIASEGVVRVEIYPQLEPDLREIQERAKEIVHERYVPNRVMAQRLGISSHLFSRITGTIFIRPPNDEKKRINIGLNLKFNSRNEEIPGFSIKRDDMWLFSDKTFKILNEYLTKFPFIFQSLATCVEKDMFSVEDLIPGENKIKKLEEIQNWLRGLPSMSEKHQKCNAEILDEFVVEAIEDIINTHIVFPKEMPTVVVTYRPDQLFRPIHYLGFSLPDPTAKYELFDRVVNIRSGISVPLGKKGTIIGKYLDESNEVNTLYDIVFDEEFIGGTTLRCSAGKGYKLSPASLINITYGLKMSGRYEQFVSSGQPLQSGPQHFHGQRHSHSRNPNHSHRFANELTFGQRMPRPRFQNNPPFVNTNFANAQTSRPMHPLNHSKNSPFQSPKHETQKSEDFPKMSSQSTYSELWNDMSTLKMSDIPLPKGSFADITASKRQPENTSQSTRPKEPNDRSKSNTKVRTQKNVPENRKNDNIPVLQIYGQNKSAKPRVELYESLNTILNNYCERHNKPLPLFEQIMVGPMNATSLKLTLFDGMPFHTFMNYHHNSADAREFLAKDALQYLNHKYGANIDLNRPKKLLSLPHFADPSHQKSPNRPKIAESFLPRPPPNWTAKSPNRFVQRLDPNPVIPESFVEHNQRIFDVLLEKRNISSKTNVNTSGNKDRNLQPKKLFDNRNDNIVNNSPHNQKSNPNRNNRKIQNDSINDNISGQRRHNPQSSGQPAFANAFVPLQVSRHNQSHRHSTPVKNSQQKVDESKDAIEINSISSEEIEILSPESIAKHSNTSKEQSNDEIEILTPDSLIASSSGGRRSRRLGVNLD